MIFPDLESKCKYFQKLFNYKLMPNGYIIAHLDGRAFSKYCRRFEKPFDRVFINAMNETAIYVAKNVQGCKFGYVQSDEITFIICDSNRSDTFFQYRINKMCSILASLATSKFMQLMMLELVKTPCSQSDLIEMVEREPLVQFDCKVWNVPNLNEVFAWINFRQIDCIRNSKQMFAQSFFSHNQLKNKNTDEQIEMVKDKYHLNWNDCLKGEKFGRFIQKELVEIIGEDNKGNQVKSLRNKWFARDGFPIQSKENKEIFLDRYFGEEKDDS